LLRSRPLPLSDAACTGFSPSVGSGPDLPASARLSSPRPQRESFKLNMPLIHRGIAPQASVRNWSFIIVSLLFVTGLCPSRTQASMVFGGIILNIAAVLRQPHGQSCAKTASLHAVRALTKIRGVCTPSISNMSSKCSGWWSDSKPSILLNTNICGIPVSTNFLQHALNLQRFARGSSAFAASTTCSNRSASTASCRWPEKHQPGREADHE
jgi:hypothetical protein